MTRTVPSADGSDTVLVGAERHETDQYETNQYETDQYETDQYETDQYETGLAEFLLYPTSAGAEHDLDTEPALAMIRRAGRNSVPTTVDVGSVTLTDAAQNAAYFVVAEALTNMEKHSLASRCGVEIHQIGGVLVLAITDDGVGGASLSRGHGLAGLTGLTDRPAGVDGTLTVTSPTGGTTQVTATIPAFAA